MSSLGAPGALPTGGALDVRDDDVSDELHEHGRVEGRLALHDGGGACHDESQGGDDLDELAAVSDRSERRMAANFSLAASSRFAACSSKDRASGVSWASSLEPSECA